jgi:hypothetical protein
MSPRAKWATRRCRCPTGTATSSTTSCATPPTGWSRCLAVPARVSRGSAGIRDGLEVDAARRILDSRGPEHDRSIPTNQQRHACRVAREILGRHNARPGRGIERHGPHVPVEVGVPREDLGTVGAQHDARRSWGRLSLRRNGGPRQAGPEAYGTPAGPRHTARGLRTTRGTRTSMKGGPPGWVRIEHRILCRFRLFPG